jgi:hypothetical protein
MTRPAPPTRHPPRFPPQKARISIPPPPTCPLPHPPVHSLTLCETVNHVCSNSSMTFEELIQNLRDNRVSTV